MDRMKVIIMCGGKGTRLREETAVKPKPMVEIGGRPILWHIMKIYDRFGYRDFILPLGYKGEVIKHDVAKYVPETEYVVKVLERHVEKAKHNLKGAPIVVAGGYGMGSKENFDMLFELAKELHAEVGASRAAVDAGFVDHDRQIGQTGVTVRPKVYIAFGISGQIQHLAGMQDSGIIISVNSDPEAPINAIADYVINGTVEEVLPKMIKYYKANNK